MNHNLPHWNMEEYSKTFRSILSSTNQKKPTGLQQEELTDLTRKNENVMMLSSQRKSSSSDVKEDQRAAGNSNNSLMEEEIASWFMYPPYELLDKDFQSDFLYEIPNPQPTITEKPNRSLGTEGLNCTHPNSSPQQNRASPTRSYLPLSAQQHVYSDHGSIVNFPHFSRSSASELQKRVHSERGESSSSIKMKSSFCGSNQVQNTNGMPSLKLEQEIEGSLLSERPLTDTSLSSGFGLSIRNGLQEMSNLSCKRKERDIEESGSLSEDGDYESADGKKLAQRSRRSRAAEVHNLSERRRRDRINEKMKALQDLIPHCTKSDKASMLDEAIEYLKSLQQQVQMMWMGSGMVPMVFPSIQHCMTRMGMGICRAPMPSISNLLQVPRVPQVSQSMVSSSSANQMPLFFPSISHLNFPNQMSYSQIPEPFPPYLGFHQLQPSPQAMNLYAYGSQMTQQNQMAAAISNSLPTYGYSPETTRQRPELYGCCLIPVGHGSKGCL
ncbi:hypothetical protein HPP92_010769 [Vanilla planifolia]|uniref:BHLH domain-containing protein n=1 Tax=Vanilla planifolia TaxID=51239 RepID=A0A835R761_VANPL|nr:hypothetical protein HPP92_010769 [Vanilla planifolia]